MESASRGRGDDAFRSKTSDVRPERGRVAPRSVAHSTPGSFSRSRALRQLELYLHKLRLLERELAEHEAAQRVQAAREALSGLRAEQELIRRLCHDFDLELPSEAVEPTAGEGSTSQG